MGVYLGLVDKNGERESGRDMVNKYYDYVSQKEKDMFGSPPDGELFGEKIRRIKIPILNERDQMKISIFEKLSSYISGPAPKDSAKRRGPWYEESKLRELIDGFKQEKKRLQRQNPVEINWEQTIELKHIALCEFAIEHNMGVEYC